MIRSFQISAVFPHLSVLENVRVALQRRQGASFQFWRSESTLETLHDRARKLIDAVNHTTYLDHAAVGELPYGRKQALEIATTLALDPELMLLDEPLAGMGHEDIEHIANLIRRVAAERTVMVEHNLSVIADLSDTITVLRRGEILAEGPYEVVSRNPQVMEAYMGAGHA